MRRYLAVNLLGLMVLQLPIAALASSGTGALSGQSAMADQALASLAFPGDPVALTGNASGAPQESPRLQRPQRSIDAVTVMRSRRVLLPHYRPGTPQPLRLPPRSVLTSRERPRDPRAMRRSSLVAGAGENKNALLFRGSRQVEPPGAESQRSARPPGTRGGGHVKQALAANPGTGIERWWTYEEQNIPGLGKALLNVGTGNLLVSATDVNAPEQGINLVFQRTYNSQSLHDVSGDDGGEPAIFGNGWTNNFDASIVYNATNGTITVYDLEGTACTYTSDGNGGWIPCAGEHAVLAYAQAQNCTYTWSKPNGTIYVFQSDGGGPGGFCTSQNLTGHLVEISSRNANNYITFTYYWDTSGITTSEHVTEIDADHSDGDKLVMRFGLVSSHNELLSITRPDQAVLQYWYDQYGNLVEVDKPGNNFGASLPGNPHSKTEWQTGDLPESYAYVGSSDQMEEACGPRCTAGMWASQADGSALVFLYSGTNLATWQVQGVLNFTPDDQTSSPLNATAPLGWSQWNTTNFQYGSSGACGSSGSNTTYMCDKDGHKTIWTTDTAARVTITKRWAVSQFIITQQAWDNSGNLISTTDANGNITQYGYDASGNMVETQLPNANDFTLGPNQLQGQSLKPLSFFSYDANNNITAYCDAFWTQNKTWVPSPGDNLCPTAQGATYFAYNYDQTNEPYGCLTDIYKPSGYHTTVTYGGSTCGLGLPSKAEGPIITQYPGNQVGSRQPTQDFTYTQYGQLHQYDRGPDGADSYDSWTLSYNPSGNQDNLPTQRTENDSTIPGNNMKEFTCYYPDGSILYTETPAQHAADNSDLCPGTAALLQGPAVIPAQATVHYYDYDGDEVKVIGYKGCSSNNACVGTTGKTKCSSGDSANPIGTTCKYYDGLDRLVETAQPYDNRSFPGSNGRPYEFYATRWMNRYIYDLSLSGSLGALTISDTTGTTASFAAYGNLYKTEEHLPPLSGMRGCFASTTDCTQPNNGQYPTASWSDVRGTSFDSLDRSVKTYELAFGTHAVVTNSYDAAGQLGELSSTVNAEGQTTTYTYDPIGRNLHTQFSSGDGDGRWFQYDPDGRIASVKGDKFGQISYAYDVDGNEVAVLEPTSVGGNYAGGSLICYQYYPDGLRESLSVGNADLGIQQNACNGITANPNPANGGISQPNLFLYAYSGDGRLAEQDATWGTNPLMPDVERFKWTYTPSGRELTETDPLTGSDAYVPNSRTLHTHLGPKTYTYGTYGRVNSLTLPGQYQQSTLIFDDEDELAGYTAAVAVGGGGLSINRTLVLNALGEMLEDSAPGDLNGFGAAQSATQSANGALVGKGDYVVGTTPYEVPPTTLEYDLRTNMVTCSTDPAFANTYPTSWPYVFRYDHAGRQTASGYDRTLPLSTTCNSGVTGLGTLTYDAENHILSSSSFNSVGSATWGPDGKQRVSNYTGPTGGVLTAHWDGDALLFATGGQANGPQLYIGKNATMDIAGDITIYDRDQTGAKVSSHGQVTGANLKSWQKVNGNWLDGWSSGSVQAIEVQKSGQQVDLQLFPGTCNGFFLFNNNEVYYKCPGPAAAYEMVRADGYSMIGGIVQGARTFDPTSAQWLTPDPYAGDVHNPMTQKPFVWNGNNPVTSSDPSGYDIGYIDPGLVNMLSAMKNGSTLFRDSFLAMAEDHNVTYNFEIGTQRTLRVTRHQDRR